MVLRYSIEAVRPSRSGKIPLLPRVLMTLLALAFFFAGIGVFLQHLSILRTWLPVEATVVRSEVIGHRNKKQRNMYRGEVELAYAVAGRDYRTPDTFSMATTSESSIRRKMETTYAAGTRHRVFYNPANPHSFRWNVGFNFTFFLLPAIFTGVGLLLIAACCFLWRLPYPPQLACRRCGNRGRLDDRYCPHCGDALSPDTAASPSHESEPDKENPEALSKRENPAALLLIGAFFGLPGLACFLGAVSMGIRNYAATQTWATTEATVTRSAIESTRDRQGKPVYRMGVEFDYERDQQLEHAAGQSIYVSGSYAWVAQRLERFSAGSRHQIRINPRDSADIRFDLENPLLNWLPTAGLGLFGFIFSAIGAALTRWGLKKRCAACRHQLPRRAAYCPGCRRPAASETPEMNA